MSIFSLAIAILIKYYCVHNIQIVLFTLLSNHHHMEYMNVFTTEGTNIYLYLRYTFSFSYRIVT